MQQINVDNEHCFGCVYFPPNLPEQAYSADDYRMLQAKRCSFDYRPHDSNCAVSRKTSCSLVDLEALNTSSQVK